jgi:hypothetical protein
VHWRMLSLNEQSAACSFSSRCLYRNPFVYVFQATGGVAKPAESPPPCSNVVCSESADEVPLRRTNEQAKPVMDVQPAPDGGSGSAENLLQPESVLAIDRTVRSHKGFDAASLLLML